MNTSTTPGASAPNRSNLREPADRSDRAERGDPRERDDFERALRDRLALLDDRSHDPGTEAAGDTPAAPPWAVCSAPVLRPADAPVVPAAAPRVELPVDATRAAIGTALQADAGAPAALGLRTDTASVWDVSLNDPRGVPVELRAARLAQAVPTQGVAAWSLTLGASARDAALLVRHAPRLDERLRARALDGAPVRVEADDEEPR